MLYILFIFNILNKHNYFKELHSLHGHRCLVTKFLDFESHLSVTNGQPSTRLKFLYCFTRTNICFRKITSKHFNEKIEAMSSIVQIRYKLPL